MLFTTWGVKSLKQFHIIISESKESKSYVKNTKTPRALNLSTNSPYYSLISTIHIFSLTIFLFLKITIYMFFYITDNKKLSTSAFLPVVEVFF